MHNKRNSVWRNLQIEHEVILQVFYISDKTRPEYAAVKEAWSTLVCSWPVNIQKT